MLISRLFNFWGQEGAAGGGRRTTALWQTKGGHGKDDTLTKTRALLRCSLFPLALFTTDKTPQPAHPLWQSTS